MADFVNNAFWYTVWDAKTGDLLASGTAAMCARRLGYKSANSFASAVTHGLTGRPTTTHLPLAQGRQAARQVHLPAGAHPAQRGGQPAPHNKKARPCSQHGRAP